MLMAMSTKVRAMAEQITRVQAVTAPRRKKSVNWVSRHIRYVAIEIGVGGIVPHDVDTVLANGYGDCKDHAALSRPECRVSTVETGLISYNSEYELPDAAVMGAFNHVILWLPEFRSLRGHDIRRRSLRNSVTFQEYGKPVVRAAASGPAVARRRFQALRQRARKTVVSMDEQGRVTGRNT